MRTSLGPGGGSTTETVVEDRDLRFLIDLLADLKLPAPAVSVPPVAAFTVNVAAGNPVAAYPARSIRVPGLGSPAAIDLTDLGSILTPTDVFDLRRRYCRAHQGQALDTPGATHYPSLAGYARAAADIYLERALASGRVEFVGRGPDELGRRFESRIRGFLQLSDDDFAGCYDYQLQPTPEYLAVIDRADQQRWEPTEPTPTMQRRRRKAASLRR